MLILKIPEMSCGHCVKTIDAALKAVDADAVLEVDLAVRTAKVTSSASEALLRKAITEAGYENEKMAG